MISDIQIHTVRRGNRRKVYKKKQVQLNHNSICNTRKIPKMADSHQEESMLQPILPFF